MISFEEINDDNVYIVKEMVLSNPEYNEMENGTPYRTDDEIIQEAFCKDTESYLIKADDTYIGWLDFLPENKKDGKPWLGLLMIHGDYHGYGFGTSAYLEFEGNLINKNIPFLRIGVLDKNDKAKRFWEKNGFTAYQKGEHKGNIITCYEKQLLRKN